MADSPKPKPEPLEAKDEKIEGVKTKKTSFPKRYVVAIMIFLGICVQYALRVNLSVAIGAMCNNHTIEQNGFTIHKVCSPIPAPSFPRFLCLSSGKAFGTRLLFLNSFQSKDIYWEISLARDKSLKISSPASDTSRGKFCNLFLNYFGPRCNTSSLWWNFSSESAAKDFSRKIGLSAIAFWEN